MTMDEHAHHAHPEPDAAPAADHAHHGMDHPVPVDDDAPAPDLAAHEDHADHSKHAGHSPEMFRNRFFVSVLLTIPLLYFSPQIQEWLGYEAVSFTGSTWVSPILASALFFYGGGPFLTGAWREWKRRQPGMMTLITIAITVAYAYSIGVSLGFPGDDFYWELATLIDIMLLGHWMEMRAVVASASALEELAALVPDEAHLVGDDGSIVDVPVSGLHEGQRVLIRPGEQVPIDGEVVEGRSSVNEAFLTGESRPVSKEPGDEVIAGGINGEGALSAVVTRTGDETTMSQIMRLVEEAQASRSGYAVLADRAAMWLTIIAIGIALPTFLIWLGFDDLTFAVTRAVTVLVIACPHALGLAIPLVNVNATGISAENGILVRNMEAFERGRDVAIVAFDKTGTLTEGRFVVSHVAVDGFDRDRALALAAGLEKGSEHPLATAIVEAAAEADIAAVDGGPATAVPGQGIEATIEGHLLRIGRPEWAKELGVEVPAALATALGAADSRGESAVVLMDDRTALAAFSMADKIRDEARRTIDELHELGTSVVMVTGDAEAVAATVAGVLGVDRYFARVLPQDKARIVQELQEEGPTAFVGDGINDAPALLTADLGIAIGAGTNVAIESADLVLVEDDPADVARALMLSKATQRKVRQNLAWATGYNVLAIPVAAGVLVGIGIVLSPAIGALFMSLSTVIVAINAMLLRRVDLSVG